VLLQIIRTQNKTKQNKTKHRATNLNKSRPNIMVADGHLIATSEESIRQMLVYLILKWNVENDDSAPCTNWNYTCEDCDEFMKSIITLTFDKDDEVVAEENGDGKKDENTPMTLTVDMKKYHTFYTDMFRMIDNACSRDITERGWDNIREDENYDKVPWILDYYKEHNSLVYYWDNQEYNPHDGIVFYFEEMHNLYDVDDIIHRFYDECSKYVKEFKDMFPKYELFMEMFQDACEEYIECRKEQIWTYRVQKK
jgi:hypothetical protein